ncbi:MAG: ATP-binding protein [Anaerosomatales bacterium]|nr:ATP-binding protein [Anaerosomatales bacterium]
MSAVPVVEVSVTEVEKVLATEEGHFADVKSLRIAPAKLTRSLSAFANAEGGELYVGIEEEKGSGARTWLGFETPEAANGHVQVFESLFPLGTEFAYEFLRNAASDGLVLKISVQKTREIKKASNDVVYVRRGAQNLPVDSPERLEILKREKGLTTFEDQTVACEPEVITNSETIIGFMLEVVPTSEPESWLRKQRLLVGANPTVAGIVLFADVPQAALPKRTGIKVYRYNTSAEQGTRETLDFDPISIEGNAYNQIHAAVAETQRIIEALRIRTSEGLVSVEYPTTAIHEIVTNAVLHRDYGVSDDIHIRIFDNRVEVLSPGTLPGHVTPENILDERFARNPSIVRLINKFPDPPNKDVGEGLNTAFDAMREMKLRDPEIVQAGGYVTVTLRHERIASPEERILEFLETHDEIANRQAREICFIGSENRMKTILQRMVRDGLIELVPGRTRYTAAYRLPTDGSVKPAETGQEQLDLGV